MANNLANDNDNDETEEKLIKATTRTGSEKLFQTAHLFEEFGFHAGDRVQTSKGPAWVVGSHNGELYFQIDQDKGASKWTGSKKADFQMRGFKLMYSPSAQYNAPQLAPLVDNEDYSDVCFVLDDGRRVSASRGILCMRSAYFSRLFNAKMKESDSSEVKLEDISQETLLSIMTYLYCGKVNIAQENAVDLVKAADLFMLDELKAMVATILTQHVTRDTVVDMLLLADQRRLTRLKDYCKQFLFRELPQSENLRKRLADMCTGNGNLALELVMTKLDEPPQKKRKKDAS